MTFLSPDARTAVIAALVDGCSIRTVERLTGIHRDTIMRLGVKVGQGCGELHDIFMSGIQVSRLELDEIHAFVGKKRKSITDSDDEAVVGDQYTFIGLDAVGRGIISYRTGKRNLPETLWFVKDLRSRVLGSPEISTDGFAPYMSTIQKVFGGETAHGVVNKEVVYAIQPRTRSNKRVHTLISKINVEKKIASGEPGNICTNRVERQNLDFRMNQKRFARSANGFSKKLENHLAAISLYVFHHNFCRVHGALGVTPAMHLRITDHVWTISELIRVATSEEVSAAVNRPALCPPRLAITYEEGSPVNEVFDGEIVETDEVAA